MADKNYTEFPSGTYDGSKVLLQADATTGELEKILLSDIPGTGGSPGGADGDVQFNDGGSFNGDSGLTFNVADSILTILSGLITGFLQASYLTKTTNYSIGDYDFTIAHESASAHTFTLPTAAGKTGRIYIIKNLGSGMLTVDTTSSQTIDGATSYVLRGGWTGAEAPAEQCNQTLIVQSNSTNWAILGFKDIKPQAFTNDVLYMMRNGIWSEMIKVSTTAPSSPYTGQFWFDIT